LRLEGFSFESSDFHEIDFKNRLRNVLFKSIANNQYAMWFHTVRRRQPTYPAGKFEPGFGQIVNERWKARHAEHQLFENNLYITIVHRGSSSYGGNGPRSMADLSHKVDRVRQDAVLRKARQDLGDVVRRFESTLSDYGARVLTIRQAAEGRMSEVLRFVSQLINLEDRLVLVPTMDLSRYLPNKRLFFGQNAIECRGMTTPQYAAIVSIKEYGPETAPGMLDGFLNLPFEFIISQSFVFSSRQAAMGKMQMQQRRMEQTDDLAVGQTLAIDEALEDAMAGTSAFGDHHLTIMPIVEKIEALQEAVAQIETELINLGIIGFREDLNMEPCFWAQLPGNFPYIARRSTISTANMAGFASLHNYPSGKAEDNHWGPAVTLLQTKSGTPYFFNFHVGDVGHSTLIGPTGSGKTALLNFLCAQARKFGGRLFYFDRNRGAEIFLRSLGGNYSVLGPAHRSGFNPLQMRETPESRSFLVGWLKSLLSAHGETFTNEDTARIAATIDGSFKLPEEYRTLSHVAAFLGMEGPGRLATRLGLWHGKGAFGNLFGSEKDVLALDNPVMGFEMGEILDSPQTLAPVLLYLFHRIASALDGTPTMIVLDEAYALFKNPLFAAEIQHGLKTFRKMNAILIFATQSVEDAIESPISRTLVSETATHIYFPNPKATEAYRTVFNLSERELYLIREVLEKEARYFLLKHGRDSVVARVDLSGMNDVMSVLSGRAETVARLQRLRTKLGDSPDQWLPAFMEGKE
jgi:type IV secretion system protein VirB4